MKFAATVALIALTVLPASAHTQSSRAPRPNIIYIMTDDHAAHAS